MLPKKKDGELVKKSYTSINHGVGGSAGSHTLGVTAGDVLFFEFSSRDAEIIDIFPRFNISYIYIIVMKMVRIRFSHLHIPRIRHLP